MEKCVLLSIRPQYCELIASGKKTIEVRKSRPKLDTPFKCYIYQTQNGKVGTGLFTKKGEIMGRSVKNGKVIGEFVCDEIYQYSTGNIDGQTISKDEMQKQSCLTYAELSAYENSTTAKEFCVCLMGLYGWHISDLQIYDKPKELSEFYHYLPDKILYNGDYDCRGGGEIVCMDMPEGGSDCEECPYGGRVYLKRPPQSWCYVEEVEEPCKTKN